MISFTEELTTKEDIYKFMTEYGSELRANIHFESEASITHLDGSKFLLKNCHYDECRSRIYIWTEHCGYFYFFKEDLRDICIKTTDKNGKESIQLLQHNIFASDIGMD